MIMFRSIFALTPAWDEARTKKERRDCLNDGWARRWWSYSVPKSVPLDKAAPAPHSPQPLARRIFAVRSDADESASKRTSTCDSKRMCSPLSGGGAVAPPFAPPPASLLRPTLLQREKIDRLRGLLAALEQHQRFPEEIDLPREPDRAMHWTLGAPEIDDRLPRRRLDLASLNEIKPETYGDASAALAFALLLARRRFDAGRADVGASGLIVWCWPIRTAREAGGLYGAGLASVGLDPTRLLLVETATAAETLWAMEESIGSGAAAIVIGCLDGVPLTPARRLALAAQAHRVPSLLVTSARSEVTPSTFTRWRIAARPSALHPFDPAAPGEPRFAVTLDRCRGMAATAAAVPCIVEWSHDAHRFGLVAGMANRASTAALRA